MAIYSKAEPQKIIRGIGWPDVDKEGRFIEIQFKHLSVISLYLPSGTSCEHRQSFKYQFLDSFLIYLNALDQSA
ncbi:MAG: hypothetical protein Q7U98_10855 [Methylicorpusculum sp.]|uniref:hypothetical protein n=1 Tax=Methylicorpusculum sp. TaxID=2713644 RepID=UPI002720A558|nr:hypothetical protein [Methylicorpusculum sp.]MDO8939648.1 hypothetical protein [Methylicorpusculum sp.]